MEYIPSPHRPPVRNRGLQARTGQEGAPSCSRARVRPDLDFDVASNPEFLREGNAIGDFMRPDRVVIGAERERAREVLQRLYRPLYLIEAPIVFTGIEAAELTKYAANAFLAMKVTLSMKWPIFAKRSVPTFMTSPAASGLMAGSGAS
jgi:UDP-glucose 6-dehydrogenase